MFIEDYERCKVAAESLIEESNIFDDEFVKFELIESYLSKKIEFCPYEFHAKNLRDLISGCLVKKGNKVKIFYNQNVSEKRQNFTKAHEVGHYLLHLNQDTFQNFNDLIDKKAYRDEDKKIEFEANTTAGMLLLNNYSLEHKIWNNTSFRDLSEEFGISPAALQRRVWSYLVFEYQLRGDIALDISKNYRYKNHIGGIKNIIADKMR